MTASPKSSVAAQLAALPQLSLSDFNQAQMQALGWANELSVSTGG